ncbi:hypothetical protein D3C74_416270 [compost metagenome]
MLLRKFEEFSEAPVRFSGPRRMFPPGPASLLHLPMLQERCWLKEPPYGKIDRGCRLPYQRMKIHRFQQS